MSVVDVTRLITSLGHWELWGYIAAGTVAIGVIGESIHELTRWFRQHRWWDTKGGKASALLLIVALVGEVVIQVKANSISGRIIATLNGKAADAAANAAKLGVTVDNLHAFEEEKQKSADDQIAAFKKFAANQVAQTDAVIAELERDKARLDQARRDAQVAANAAEIALAAFRKEAEPRSMSAAQRSLFIAAIKGKFRSIIVESIPNLGDDSYLYAMEVIDALKAAGVDAKYQQFPVPFKSIQQMPGSPGLYVWEIGEAARITGRAVLSAFAAAGIAAGEYSEPLGGAATARAIIVVAPKAPLAPRE